MRHDYTLLLLLLLFCFVEIIKSVNTPDNQNPLVFNSESSGIEDDEEINGSKSKIAILRITVFYDASQWTNKCDENTKNDQTGYFQGLLSNGKTIKHFNFKDISVKRTRDNCAKPTDF